MWLVRRLAMAILVLLSSGGCVERAPAPMPGNLLVDLDPIDTAGISHGERLTDGLAATEGDHWLTGITARLASTSSYAVWDLGKPTPLRCALLQGDNNDAYHVSGSEDGQRFEILWSAEPAPGAGLRMRQGTLEKRARYVRVTARGGDGLFSIGEVALFSECPKTWPALDLPRAKGVSPDETARTRLWLFAAVAGLALAVSRRGGPRAHLVLFAIAIVLGGRAAWALVEIYPFFDAEPLLRAVVAILAGILVFKEAFVSERHAADPRVARATLVVLGTLALGCYYHFGMPQFSDAAKGRRTLVHTFDMRHYFPAAKYFRELRFDGLYLASLAAYVDLADGGDPRNVGNVRLRDLTTYDMTTGAQAAAQLPAIRARFSPERWEEFKGDMKYFLDTMGPGDYLGSMQDHGGNATPVWLLGAWAIFRNAPATEWTLSLAGLIDPVLVLGLFVVLWRTFGLRVMLYTLVLFGATDFYQFGSNLVGSTLRQDWLCALGLGACALRRGRHVLGGGLFAYAGLIRAFPALGAMFLLVPIAWWAFAFWRERRRLPSVPDLRSRQEPALRAVGGAAVTVVVLVALTSGLFGFRDGWGTWVRKIELHAVGPSTNNVGLRNVLAYRPQHASGHVIRNDHPEPWVAWQRHQMENFAQLRPLFYLINAAAVALALLACRGLLPYQAALFGLLLIPFVFYPSNYYCHFIFLLPLAAAADGPAAARDRRYAWVVLVLAALCVGQYFTLAEGWSDLRYTYQSFVLLGAFAAILGPLGYRGWRDLRPRAPAAQPSLAPDGPPI